MRIREMIIVQPEKDVEVEVEERRNVAGRNRECLVPEFSYEISVQGRKVQSLGNRQTEALCVSTFPSWTFNTRHPFLIFVFFECTNHYNQITVSLLFHFYVSFSLEQGRFPAFSSLHLLPSPKLGLA